VAVAQNLKTIAEQLRKLGYEVVTYGEYNFPIDAFVYTGENLLSANVIESASPSWNGILMINAENKSIKQIDFILKNRTYTPLF